MQRVYITRYFSEANDLNDQFNKCNLSVIALPVFFLHLAEKCEEVVVTFDIEAVPKAYDNSKSSHLKKMIRHLISAFVDNNLTTNKPPKFGQAPGLSYRALQDVHTDVRSWIIDELAKDGGPIATV